MFYTNFKELLKYNFKKNTKNTFFKVKSLKHPLDSF